MAYFNQYNPYQPQMFPTQMSGSLQATQMSPANAQSGIIWVQGAEAAKSYLVAPGNTVQLWDSEAQVIYLKSADASGMPSIKTLDYTIRESQAQPQVPMYDSNVASDIKALKERVELLSRRMKELTKESEENE